MRAFGRMRRFSVPWDRPADRPTKSIPMRKCPVEMTGLREQPDLLGPATFDRIIASRATGTDEDWVIHISRDRHSHVRAMRPLTGIGCSHSRVCGSKSAIWCSGAGMSHSAFQRSYCLRSIRLRLTRGTVFGSEPVPLIFHTSGLLVGNNGTAGVAS